MVMLLEPSDTSIARFRLLPRARFAPVLSTPMKFPATVPLVALTKQNAVAKVSGDDVPLPGSTYCRRWLRDPTCAVDGDMAGLPALTPLPSA